MSAFGDQIARDLRFRAAQIAGDARDRLERALKNAAPVGKARPFQTHEPGELQRSISVSVRFDQQSFTFTAIAAAPHASFTETGTGAFDYLVQRPQSPSGRPGAVRFFWDRSGNIEFRPTGYTIHNPGQAGSRWFSKTLEMWPDILREAAA